MGLPTKTREVLHVVDAAPTIEGAGVKVRRALGGRALTNLDPFLLLDAFRSDDPADYLPGFPEHPHRGFETVTYLIDGAVEHRDSLGNHGRLAPGSVQWMTAGHGIVHAEMPKQAGAQLLGFQLWVNLPATQKLMRPRYQDIAPARIVDTTIGDASVRLIAGQVRDAFGPVDGIVTAPTFLDAKLPANGRFSHALSSGHTAFVYVFDGAIELGGARTKISRDQLAVLGPGDEVTAGSERGGRMVLVAARPIGEPIARRGPFVMNTEAELDRAFDDYRSGHLTDL
ncbi:MAG: pirin family protein [Polyangiales bacterium]